MQSKRASSGRMLKRCMVNEQQSIDGCKNVTSKKHQQENDEICEITAISGRRKLNKAGMLPSSRTIATDSIPNLYNTAETRTQESRQRMFKEKNIHVNNSLGIGLSDLGANTKSSSSHRPATTGRMLPHIGYKHLQKDTSSLLSRSSLVNDFKRPQENTKLIFGNKNLEDTSNSRNQSFQEKVGFQKGKSPQCISSSNMKGSSASPCLVNTKNFQKLTITQLPIAPPDQNRKPPNPVEELINKDQTSVSARPVNRFSGKQASNITAEPADKVSKTNLPRPGSGFKPQISVRNLQLPNEKLLLTTNTSMQPSHHSAMTRSLNSAMSQKREREFRLRKTHPVLLSESNKVDLLTTIAKEKPTKNDPNT